MYFPIRHLTPRRLAVFAIVETLVAAVLAGVTAVIYPPGFATMLLLLAAMTLITIVLLVTGS
ncbi:MAG TPA: hypothetical protein PK089_02230 [Methanoregulaceae archaeon]|nr:hypothetical protein [Methanoregulaceae archaeon]HQJ87609.1 hypothetical protein [Methanoregulaceae archaeon]